MPDWPACPLGCHLDDRPTSSRYGYHQRAGIPPCDACRDRNAAYQRLRAAGAVEPFPPRPCKHCGRVYRPGHPKGRWCPRAECQQAANRYHSRQRSKRLGTLAKRRWVTCAHCGIEWRTSVRTARYCMAPDCRRASSADYMRRKRANGA